MIFSVGPTKCATYQVCGVYIECVTINWLGQPLVISTHYEAEMEGYFVYCRADLVGDLPPQLLP